MSIYSGFATRALETSYNQHLCDAISLLQSLLLYCLQSKQYIEIPNWSDHFSSTFSRMFKLEQQKHLLPRYTDYMKDLDSYIKSISTPTSPSKIAKIAERPGPLNLSMESLLKGSSSPGRKSYSSRHSSVAINRKREQSYSFQKKPKKIMNQTRIKGYQDMVLKSILNDLSASFV